MLHVRPNISVSQLNNRASMINLQGDLDASAEYPLTKAYDEATHVGADVIVLNLSRLEYMNSYGIGVLVSLLSRARSRNQRLLGYGLSEHYQRVFELTRLNQFIRLFPGEREALMAANSTKKPA